MVVSVPSILPPGQDWDRRGSLLSADQSPCSPCEPPLEWSWTAPHHFLCPGPLGHLLWGLVSEFLMRSCLYCYSRIRWSKALLPEEDLNSLIGSCFIFILHPQFSVGTVDLDRPWAETVCFPVGSKMQHKCLWTQPGADRHAVELLALFQAHRAARGAQEPTCSSAQ